MILGLAIGFVVGLLTGAVAFASWVLWSFTHK